MDHTDRIDLNGDGEDNFAQDLRSSVQPCHCSE